jgi:hypothetical protein
MNAGSLFVFYKREKGDIAPFFAVKANYSFKKHIENK